MTLVPALAEQHAAHVARLARMGGQVAPSVVVIPKPAPVAQPVRPYKIMFHEEAVAGLPWTDKETAHLRTGAANGLTARDIASTMVRSRGAVQDKARALGLTLTKAPPKRPLASMPRSDDITDHYHLVVDTTAPCRVRSIIRICADRGGISVVDIMGEGRAKQIVLARQQAMWLAAKETKLSLPRLGRIFGKDHTTILHAVRRENWRTGQDVRGYGFWEPRK